MILSLALAAFLAPSPEDIDPHARAALDASVAAYRSLRSFSAEVESRGWTAEIAYEAPGRIVVAAKNGRVNPALVDPVSRAVSDGAFLYSVSPKRPGAYLKRPAPRGFALFDAAVGPVLMGGFVRYLLAGRDPAQAFVESSPGARLTALSMGDAGRLDGVAVETVQATLESPAGEAMVVVFEIGADDRLVRRILLRPKAAPAGAAMVAETYRDVRANPPLPPETFAFVPPKGARAVAAYESPLHPALKPGARPFDLAAKDLAGRPFAWSSLRGKVVLLDFWATWCMPCVAEVPHLAALRKAHAPRGFEVVSVSADAAQDGAKLAAFVAKNKMAWPQLHDAGGATVRRYAVRAFPTTLLVGRDGRIAAVNPSGADLDAAILRALAARSPGGSAAAR